jgi:hypothetical protein
MAPIWRERTPGGVDLLGRVVVQVVVQVLFCRVEVVAEHAPADDSGHLSGPTGADQAQVGRGQRGQGALEFGGRQGLALGWRQPGELVAEGSPVSRGPWTLAA